MMIAGGYFFEIRKGRLDGRQHAKLKVAIKEHEDPNR
jgi:hypothetical protein